MSNKEKATIPTILPSRIFNIKDFGADPSGKTDNSIALQKFVDYIQSLPNPNNANYYKLLVDENYQCSKPVFYEANNIHMEGTTQGTGFTWYHQAGPGLVVGANRSPAGQSVPADTRVDAFGKLDTTVAPVAGKVFGFSVHSATNPDIRAHILLEGTAFALARNDGYESTKKLTLELAFESTSWNYTDYTIMLGGIEGRKACPVSLLYDPRIKGLEVRFSTSDYIERIVTIPLSADSTTVPSGMQRVTLQWDLVNGAFGAFVNNVEVKPDLSQIGTGWGPGLNFKINENAAFGVGACDFYSQTFGYDRGVNGEWIFYGLRLSDDLVYNMGNPGQPQTRIDGNPINDKSSYYTCDKTTFAWLRFDDNNPIDLNLVCIGQRDQDGNVALWGYALVLPSSKAIYAYQSWTTQNLSFKNITLSNNADAKYGSAFTGLQALNIEMDHCNLSGKGYGWQSLNNPTNQYPLRFRNCNFSGNYCAYYGQGQDVWMYDCSVPHAGKYGMFFAGSGIYIDGGFWSDLGFNSCRAAFRMRFGTNTVSMIVKNVQIDHEYAIRYAQGIFWIDCGMDQQKLVIDAVDFWGTSPAPVEKSIPFIRLDGGNGGKGIVNVSNILSYTMRSMITVDNRMKSSTPAKWRGRITGINDPANYLTGKVVEYLNGTEKSSYIEVDTYKLPPAIV
jgi:hypothetical protein